jgi:hypothetical protein
VPGSLPALSRGPDSKSSFEHPPRFLARPERSSGRQLPGLRPVLRVCTHSLRAGSVHPRRLSWGSCPPVLGAGRPAHHRLRSTWTVIHARRAADGCRILPVRRIAPPAANWRAPFQSVPSDRMGAGCPVPALLWFAGRRSTAVPRPLQGLVPRSDSSRSWRTSGCFPRVSLWGALLRRAGSGLFSRSHPPTRFLPRCPSACVARRPGVSCCGGVGWSFPTADPYGFRDP